MLQELRWSLMCCLLPYLEEDRHTRGLWSFSSDVLMNTYSMGHKVVITFDHGYEIKDIRLDGIEVLLERTNDRAYLIDKEDILWLLRRMEDPSSLEIMEGPDGDPIYVLAVYW